MNSLNVDFREFDICNSTAHRKSMPARPVESNIDDSVVQKRGSVYQSSREIRRMSKLAEGRTNSKLNHRDEGYVSFEVVDSLSFPFQNLYHINKISAHASLDAELILEAADIRCPNEIRMGESPELSFCNLPEEHTHIGSSCNTTTDDSEYRQLWSYLNSSRTEYPCAKRSTASFERKSVREPNAKCGPILDPKNGQTISYETDTTSTLSKSFSEKVGTSYLTYQLENGLLKGGPKTRFSPLKKLLNPIMKSKSLRSPSLVERENAGVTTYDPCSVRSSLFSKFLSEKFLKATNRSEPEGHSIGRDQTSVFGSSPAHLHGNLRLIYKHGILSFEFSVKDPEDVLTAKTWRTDDTLNCVYTFYGCRKKCDHIGWGTKDRKRHSPSIVGQMKVSSFLHSDENLNCTTNQSTRTEFILYDLVKTRRGFASEERSECSSDFIQPFDITLCDNFSVGNTIEEYSSTELGNHQVSTRHANSDCDSEASSSYLCERADLCSHLEAAAIVIQMPVHKIECFDNKQVDESVPKEHENSSIFPAIDPGRKTISNSWNFVNIRVVTPSGTHGLPTTENGCPSSLLNRWLSGGGCDCGGWDMACPIVVFGNSCVDMADCLTVGSQQPIVLSVQGAKEKVPALSFSSDEKGQYLVHFHAKLSALQAFSICIAILHSSKAFPRVDEQTRKSLRSGSLKVLAKDKVRHFVKAVATEENRNAEKRVELIPPLFLLNLPFTPMGRV